MNKLKSLSAKKLVLIAIASIVLIITGIFKARKNQDTLQINNDTRDQVTDMKTTEVEVKDGVYTNYTYGFSFKYDDIVFSPYEGSSSFLTNGGDFSSIEGNSNDGAFLRISTKTDEESIAMFDKLFYEKQTWSDNVISTNIMTYSKSDTKYVIYNFENSESYGGEHSFEYRLLAKTPENVIVTVSIGTIKKDELTKYSEEFNQIADSFTFNEEN